VKRANGHCLPDLDATLARMQKTAEAEGVESHEAEKIIRTARRNEEIVGIPTELGVKVGVLRKRGSVSGRMAAAIKKGLIYG
jgi:hypothetical protein